MTYVVSMTHCCLASAENGAPKKLRDFNKEYVAFLSVFSFVCRNYSRVRAAITCMLLSVGIFCQGSRGGGGVLTVTDNT